MECSHDWFITEYSNAIQLDDMGYPLRLVIGKCDKCGDFNQFWVDIAESDIEDEDFIIKWKAAES